MKFLLACLLLPAASAGIITANLTAPCSGGTYAHITFTNCTTTLAYAVDTVPAFAPQPMYFSWDTSGLMDAGPNGISMALNSSVGLITREQPQYITSTITADFQTASGWHINSFDLAVYQTNDDDRLTAEYANATCTSAGNPCDPRFNFGTITITKHIETVAVCGLCAGGTHGGFISNGWLMIHTVQGPEPATMLLVGAFLVEIARRRTKSG